MVTAFHTTEGFYEAVDAARDLDAFTDEHLDSEYTRGIVELIVHAFMYGNDDAGNGERHEYVRRVGSLGARLTSTTLLAEHVGIPDLLEQSLTLGRCDAAAPTLARYPQLHCSRPSDHAGPHFALYNDPDGVDRIGPVWEGS